MMEGSSSIEDQDDRRPVAFPPVGMSHIVKKLSHLIAPWTRSAGNIEVVVASQPNSYPHLGTVTTMLGAFALAKHVQSEFGLPTSVVFDCLENSPSPNADDKILHDGLVYQRSLEHSGAEGISLADRNLEHFIRLLTWASTRSNVEYRTRPYREFQSLPDVRGAITEILNNRNRLEGILSPSKQNIHVRFPCPVCNRVEKAARTLRIEARSNRDSIDLFQSCYEHGEHSISLAPGSMDFVDTNATMRDVLKGVLAVRQYDRDNLLTIMYDGGDWGGNWPLAVFAQAMAALDVPYYGIPIRFFAPILLDWSGAKFSKSLYVASSAYENVEEHFVNFRAFEERYAEKGVERLWQEVEGWIGDPRRFFRNYSFEYFKQLMKPLESTNQARQMTLDLGATGSPTDQVHRTPILISLESQYYDMIKDGTKAHEYRRRFFREATTAFVYVKKPVAGIAAALVFDPPVEASPREIGAIAESEFPGTGMRSILDYLGVRKTGFAAPIVGHFPLTKIATFEELKKRFPNFTVPQSYLFLAKKPDLLAYLVSLLPPEFKD